jgi:hypothetical protein
LKISKLIEFDQALTEVDVLLFVNAERDNILRIYCKSIWNLFVAFHGCAHLLDHALSEVALLVLPYTLIGVLFILRLVNDEDTICIFGPVCSQGNIARLACLCPYDSRGIFFQFDYVTISIGNIMKVPLYLGLCYVFKPILLQNILEVDAFNPGSIDEIIMRRYFQGMLMV